MRRVAALFVIGVILAIAAPMSAANSSSPGPPACQVTNLATSATYTSETSANPLQDAIDAATPGDTLQIRGTCVGSFVIAKDLTLAGKPFATLDGNHAGASTLTIAGAAVSIRRITIRNGGFGGIHNVSGTVELIDSLVTENASEPTGGGITLDVQGSLSLSYSRVSDIVAASQTHVTYGGGFYNCTGCTLSLIQSTVSGNSGGLGGGIANDGGTVTLTGSTVGHNSATFGGGGGIYNAYFGVVTLDGPTNIRFNTSLSRGGGISNSATVVAATGWTGHVSQNSPNDCEPALTLGSKVCD
jgi:hypothetical protein